MGELLQLAEKRRVELNSLFKKIVPNVYFQPPENIKMKYPCIRYEFSNLDILHTEKKKWLSTGVNYKVILITASPNPKAFPSLSNAKVNSSPTTTFTIFDVDGGIIGFSLKQ